MPEAFNTNTIMDGVEIASKYVKKLEELNNLEENNTIETSASTLESIIESSPSKMLNKYLKKPEPKKRKYVKIQRNDPCPCGSGKKYKNCCLDSGKYEGFE